MLNLGHNIRTTVTILLIESATFGALERDAVYLKTIFGYTVSYCLAKNESYVIMLF